MNLTMLWISVLCGWSLLNFWILPLSAARWKAVDVHEKMVKAGSVAVAEKLRDLTAVAAISLTAILILVQLANFGADTSNAMPKAIIQAATSVYAWAKGWSDTYGNTVSVFALLGAAIGLVMVAKHAKDRVAQAWIEKANEVRTRLHEDAGEIVQCLDDIQLRPIAEHITTLISLLQADEQGTSAESLTQEKRESLQEELSHALSTLAIEKARGELDFGSAISKPGYDEIDGEPTLWSRIGRVLSSERLCKDMGLFRKPISYVLTSLIVISLISWSAEPMANSLRLAINNLRINSDASEVQRSLDEAMSMAQQNKPAPSKGDTDGVQFTTTIQSATKLIARAAVQELTHSPVISQIAKIERNPLADTEYVRAAIIGQQIPTDRNPEPISKLRNEIANSVVNGTGNLSDQRELGQHVEKQVQPLIEQLYKESPDLMHRLTATLEARYATPVAPLDAQGKLLEKVLDAAVGGIDARPTSELGKQGQKLVSDFGKKALNTWVDSYARAYVAEIVVEAARPEVTHTLRQTPTFELSKQASEFLDEFVGAEGKNWVATGHASEEERMSVAVANAVAKQHSNNPEMSAVIRDRLSGYDSLFPSEPDGSGASGGIGGGGGGSGGDHKATPGSSNGRSFAQSRATNFHVASRSFRVRGVLIGQEHSVKGVAINDLRWAVHPSRSGGSTRMGLELKVDQTWRDIGSFDAGVVNQALRYGADRRVVATTITPGDGKIVSRITYLHPALLDTPLGCRVVEADRLIDTFSFGSERDTGSPMFVQMLQDREQMGRWLAVLRLADSVTNAIRGGTCPEGEIDQIVEEEKLGSVAFSKNMTEAVSRFVSDEERKKTGSTQFLGKAHQCAIGPTAQVAQCLCDLAASPAAKTSPYWLPVDHTSQFRERETTLTPDLAWLQRSPDSLGHIDFWVHTTLALHERSAYGEERVDEASASTINFPDEQLASLRVQVRSKIPQYLTTRLHSTSVGEFMSPLEDFVLLQRLFRAGLDGRLGPNFPIDKLITLERETRKFVPSQPTIRWEGSVRLEKTLEEADAKAFETYKLWEMDAILRKVQRRPTCDRVSN